MIVTTAVFITVAVTTAVFITVPSAATVFSCFIIIRVQVQVKFNVKLHNSTIGKNESMPF